MNHNFLSKLVGLLGAALLLCAPLQTMADDSEAYDPSKFISIGINTGNPTYPYPQFLEYTGGGKSLAKYNAEGVTHADMEKAGRESYEIMMHRCRYMGGTHCGVPYITFNHESVPGNYGTFVSEGDGYAMLAAAIFGDQKTFNGLYMWVHDNRFSGVERFQDGKVLRATENDFAGPYLAGWQCDETTTSMSPCHSATDGDVDIAMAMLIAYKQWGEYMMQDGKVVNDWAGNPISLKYEAQRVIGALVDTLAQYDKGSGANTGYLCGVVGIDGYEKRGNSWGELTRWRFTDLANATYPGVNGPYNGGPNLYGIYGGNYIDYDAPSYFEEFWRWLKNSDGVDEKNKDRANWEIHQFKRAAASGNWLNKQAYDQGYEASIGQVQMTTDGSPTFGVYVGGEDFRYPWRHLMDYLWHGNANYDWDPTTHQVIDGTNTSEYDMGMRHAKLLKDPSDGGTEICSKMGASPDPGQPSWSGVSQIPQQWNLDGTVGQSYHTNYSPGAGSPAAVISGDLDLLADVYRQCELLWDGNNTAAKLDPEERYIGSTPKYFHGWFRTLGMLVCSGNLAAPEDMKPIANAKVYMSVDKTYAYQGDDVTYGVQFRNYGTLDAEGVTITTKLDPNYDFVSATKGGVYNASTHSITWAIGSIPGFKTGGLDATMDSVFFTVNVRDTLNKRICLTSTISGTNFDDWVSNEYPNHATYTMERNCVDILASRSLFIKKTANRNKLNPKDVVAFTVEFGNESKGEDSWMNGGRDNVRISYGTFLPSPAYQFYSLYRFWNDSYESYINMSNYRVSYFMYDAAAIGLVSEKNSTGWTFVVDNQNDLDKYGYNPETGPISFAYQKIPQGSDEHGKWNQRLMIRFADVLMAPSTHVYDKLDSQYLLHKGVWGPGFIRARLASNPAADLSTRVTDDWSFDTSVGEKTLDGQGTTFTLISPCWANYDNPGYEIDNYSRHVCNPTSVGNYGRILVEEFDGYTWRRIQGTGPLPGREAYNVTIADTIPYELEWAGWVDSTALKDDTGAKIQATYTPHNGKDYTGIVYWTIPTMLVGEKDKLVYKCKARDLGCPDVEDTYYKNVAWIWSDTDSPDSAQVELMTTCAELPPVIEPQTSLFKTADTKMAQTGDKVSYKLKFINTEGTEVDADCKSQDGWMALGSGSVAPVGTDGLKLSTNGSSAYFFAPEKSYGADGSIMMTFGGSPSSTQELYFVMRYVSGTPGTTSFKGICMKMFINKDGKHNFGYELYNDGTLIEKEGSSWQDVLSFPGDADAPTFKFVLNGDHLYMYVNDEENDWESVVKDWTGLTSAGPGYFGMYVNSNGNSSTCLTKFDTQLDYAFDVTLSDQLPEELGNISDITGEGVWDETKNVITWPTQATTVTTALAPNDSIVYTFTSEVLSCNQYINNYGLATVYGLDTLKVLNTIECGESACELEEVTLKSAVKTICETDSALLKATVSPKGSYYYQYFKDGEPYGKLTSKLDSIYVNEAGSYSVKVFADKDTTTEPVCFVKSKTVAIAVDTVPATILADTSACSGSSIDLKATETAESTLTYLWSDGSTDNTLTVDSKGTYTVEVTNGECVAKDTAEVSFGSVTLKNGVFTLGGVDYSRADYDGAPMCPGIEGTLSVNYEADGDEYTWTSDPKDATMVADGKSISISPTVETKYYVSFKQGCDAIDSFTVSLGEPMEIKVEKTPLCNSVQITATTEDSNNPVFHWSLDGVALESTEDYIVLNKDYSKGTVSVYATATDGCTSDVTDVEFQNNSMTAVIDGSPSVCPGKTTTLKIVPTTTGLDETPTYTYAWLDNTGSPIAGETLESTTVGAGIYYGVVSNGLCIDTIKHEILEGSGEHVGTFAVNDSVLYGSPKVFGSCGDALTIVADYKYDEGTSFVWKVDGVEQTSTTNTLTIPEVTADMVVTLQWKNECDAYDTLNIHLQDDVTFTADAVKDCDFTTVKMSSDMPSTHYYWTTSAGTTYEGANYVADIATYPTASGSADVLVKSEGYCEVTKTISFTIDTLAVKLEAVSPVCLGDAPTLTPSYTSSNADETVTYTYAYRKAGSNSKFTAISDADLAALQMNEDLEFQVTATLGSCTATDVATVAIGTPERDGVLSINGDAVTALNANGTKVYKTCGGEALTLAVSHTSTADDYTWNVTVGSASAPAGTGNSIAVTPSTTDGSYVGQYIVTYTNKCPVTDTVNIEVYPLDAVADWTTGLFNQEHCEGESASAVLQLTGFDATADGAYIKWFKDGELQTAFNNKTSVEFASLIPANAGEYSYEVSNGVCVRPTVADKQTLVVKPYVSIAAFSSQIVVTRGEDTTIELNVTPADAAVEWTEAGSAIGNTNPLVMSAVDKDHTLTATVSAENYCSDSVSVNILVDAKPEISLSADVDAICAGESVILTADTTGTGKMLYPNKFRITYYQQNAAGEYDQLGNGASITVSPDENATYKAVATYGNLTVESEPVKVNVYAKATYTLAFKDSVCAGESVDITVNDLTPSDATITWGEDATLAGNGSAATATPETTTLYNFVITQNNGTCSQSESFTVHASSPVEVQVPEDMTICLGQKVQLSATVFSGNPSFYQWSVEGSDSVVSKNTRFYTTPDETTTYKFEAGDGVCEASSATVTVEVADLPVITDVTDAGIKMLQIVAEGGTSPYTYAADNDEYSSSDIVKVKTYGVHTLYVQDYNGCTASYIDTVAAPAIDIPIVVTPNGDGANDLFEIPGMAESYPDSKISIFDRYGKKLAEYNASDGGWDGTYNGHKMPSTDYWYEIYVYEIRKTYTGHFTLLNDY